MFDGFSTESLPTERGEVFARIGGNGPPLLLLHGYPETHLMWHSVAPSLAERFTVIAAEGHDRGGRVAYRMSLDHPDRIAALAVLDIVPTAEMWNRAGDRFALRYWRWSFLAQPAPLPERLILGDPDADFESHLRSIGLGGDPERFSPQVLDAYRTQAADPGAVRNACEDYRAGATIDRVHDEADRGRVIDCPVLVLWGERGGLATLFGDVLAIWGRWAADVRGRAIDASHFLAEDRPQEVADEFAEFFAPTDRR